MMLLKKNLINLLVILLALGFLLFWLWLAWNGAKLRQQAEVVEKNAFALRQGMEYFFNDYDRFPTTGEFADNLAMLPYYSLFPPAEFSAGTCNKSFVYKRLTQLSYELNYCLSEASGSFKAGWNKIIGSEVAE